MALPATALPAFDWLYFLASTVKYALITDKNCYKHGITYYTEAVSVRNQQDTGHRCRIFTISQFIIINHVRFSKTEESKRL